jgi:hypothetical protein
MTSLEMDLIRREADDRARRARDLFGRIGVSPAPCKSVNSVGDATAQPAIAQRRGTAERRRLGVSGPHISSKRLAYSQLPDATPRKDQVIWQLNAL